MLSFIWKGCAAIVIIEAKIAIPLVPESFIQFYDRLAFEFGVQHPYALDHTKIYVSQSRYDYLRSYCDNLDDNAFAAQWLGFGPTVSQSLIGDEVLVLGGFLRAY